VETNLKTVSSDESLSFQTQRQALTILAESNFSQLDTSCSARSLIWRDFILNIINHKSGVRGSKVTSLARVQLDRPTKRNQCYRISKIKHSELSTKPYASLPHAINPSFLYKVKSCWYLSYSQPPIETFEACLLNSQKQLSGRKKLPKSLKMTNGNSHGRLSSRSSRASSMGRKICLIFNFRITSSPQVRVHQGVKERIASRLWRMILWFSVGD